jgi:hypothetical protein
MKKIATKKLSLDTTTLRSLDLQLPHRPFGGVAVQTGVYEKTCKCPVDAGPDFTYHCTFIWAC